MNEQIYLQNVKENGIALKHVPDNFKTDEIMKCALLQDYNALKFCTKGGIINNITTLISIIQKNPSSWKGIYEYLSKANLPTISNLFYEEVFKLLLANSNVFVPEEFKTNLFYERLAKESPIENYVNLPLEFKEKVRHANYEKTGNLYYLKKEERTREMCLKSFELDVDNIKYFPKEVWDENLAIIVAKKSLQLADKIPKSVLTVNVCLEISKHVPYLFEEFYLHHKLCFGYNFPYKSLWNNAKLYERSTQKERENTPYLFESVRIAGFYFYRELAYSTDGDSPFYYTYFRNTNNGFPNVSYEKFEEKVLNRMNGYCVIM